MTDAATQTTAKALSVTDLRKTYKGGVEAVKGLSFTIEPGEIFALLGPNGAGKTTTIRMIATLLRPTSGSIAVCGHDVQTHPDRVREVVGYVPQELALDRYLTGRQHLELSARLYRIPKAEQAARIDQALDVVELADRADEGIKRYSGGMKKRLDIACGLLHRPKLLILDEPTQGLDLQTRYRIWSFVEGLRADGTAVLLTTHDMEEADHLSDRIAIVDHGEIQALGTGNELKTGYGGDMIKIELGRMNLSDEDSEALRALPGVKELMTRGRALLFVSDDARTLAPKLAEWLDEKTGEPPRTVSFGLPSLDDVFLKITGHEIRDDA